LERCPAAGMGVNLCGGQTRDGKVNEARLSNRGNRDCALQRLGEMAEWLKAHAWKACVPQGTQGSNPCLSAILWNPTPYSNGEEESKYLTWRDKRVLTSFFAP
jgi:hypothetical protein